MTKFFLTLIFILTGILLFAPDASAGIISKPPNNLGLVGYWSFEDGAGSQVADMSGNGHHGAVQYGSGSTTVCPTPETNADCPLWTYGKFGSGLHLVDGGNVSLGAANNFSFATQSTISAWVRFTTTERKRVTLFENAGVERLSLRMNYNAACTGGLTTGLVSACYRDAADTAEGIQSSVAINDGKWHHLVFTINGTNAELFVDGVSVASDTDVDTTNTYDFGTDTLRFGSSSTVLSVDEDIDEIRFYNRAISAAEIAGLYRSGLAKTGSSPTNTLTNGLVGYWSFDGPTISGSTVTDLSGSGYNGTINNARPGLGKIGQGMEFFGTGASVSHVELVDIPFGGTSPISVCAWAKLNNTSVSGRMIEQSDEIVLQYANGTVQFILNSFTSGDRATTASGLLSSNTWHHICGTYETGGDIIVYVDAVEGDRSTPTGTYANSAATFDISDDNAASDFNGFIDEVRIYNRALSADEVKRLYNMALPKFNTTQTGSLTNGLVGHWSFDGPTISGSTVTDLSGSGYSGTINSASPSLGKIGQGMEFFGSGASASHVELADIPFGGTDPISICAWAISNDASVAAKIVGQSSEISLQIPSSRPYEMQFILNSFTTNDRAETPGLDIITNNTWHHTCGTYESGGDSVLYVNGIERDRATPTGVYANSASTFDISDDATTGDWNGVIDEVRIYNRALSASEVTQLYNMGR